MRTEFFTLAKGNPADPPVLLLHGLLGGARNLFRLAQEVATAGFFALAHDQRGHGHSPRSPDGRYSIPDLARDVFTVLDSRGIRAAHLVGHSLGGRVALAAAALDPARVMSLSLLDVGPRIGPRAFQELKGVIDPLPGSFPSREEAEHLLAERFQDQGLRQFLLSNLHVKDGSLTWFFDLAGIRTSLLPSLQADQTDAWRAVTCPAHVLRGENSPHFRAEELELMLSLNPGARSTTIKNAGHWLHVDNFVDTAAAVVDFLKAVKK